MILMTNMSTFGCFGFTFWVIDGVDGVKGGVTITGGASYVGLFGIFWRFS